LAQSEATFSGESKMSQTTIGGLANNPYTIEHWKLLRMMQRKLHDIAPIIDKAEKCNINCSDLRAVHDGLSASLEALQAEFFTPGPTSDNAA
jgi:hypothetical protein